MSLQLEYVPGPTVSHFFLDFDTEFCAIMSPVGLGKTSALIVKALYISYRQCPDASGVRHTRHAFVRGTYQQLVDSTVKSFVYWIPKEICKMRRSPPISGMIEMMPLHDQDELFGPGSVINGVDLTGKRIGDTFPNGTYVQADFRFIALDSQNAIGDLRSTEYTCMHFDEPDQMENLEDVLTEAHTRLGRWPAAQMAPLTCSQINMAYNPPAYKSFLEKYFRPENEQFDRKLYRIPPPLLPKFPENDPDNWQDAEFYPNPDAEGVQHQPKGIKYWHDIVNANRHDPDKITRLVLGDYTFGQGGRPIFPQFQYTKHVPDQPVQPRRSAKLVVAMDWGMTPCCVFMQLFDGKLKIISELTSVDTPVHTFLSDMFVLECRKEYPGFDIVVTGDPSGSYARDTGPTPFSLVAGAGFKIMPHVAQDPEKRWAAVRYFLDRDMLEVNENCEELLEGFRGGYQWEKATGSKTVRKALKNRSSHIQDALQAGCLYFQGGHERHSVANDPMGYKQESRDELANSDFLFI